MLEREKPRAAKPIFSERPSFPYHSMEGGDGSSMRASMRSTAAVGAAALLEGERVSYLLGHSGSGGRVSLYGGTVAEWDASTGKHRIRFDDGEEGWYSDLTRNAKATICDDSLARRVASGHAPATSGVKLTSTREYGDERAYTQATQFAAEAAARANAQAVHEAAMAARAAVRANAQATYDAVEANAVANGGSSLFAGSS